MKHRSKGADVIVIGAGAAGSVVARRLHDAGASVLVVEAGGPDSDERIADPLRSVQLRNGVNDWAYTTVPQQQLRGRQLAWAQGRVVGGSSSINTLVWIRGCASDFDHWAYLGNDGWSYDQLLPLLRRIEDFDGGPSDLRGSGGPMPVMSLRDPDPIHVSVIAGMQALGVPYNPDHNGSVLAGTGYCQYNIRDGQRVSAATAYLAPVVRPNGVELITNATVRRLLVSNGRCAGVEWEHDGRRARARAGTAVVLCAGAIGSPRLLLLSGIGPAEELRRLSIAVSHDAPGVGQGLHDHVHVPLIFSTIREIGPSTPGRPTMQTNTFIATRPGLYSPDIQSPSLAEVPDYRGLAGLPPQGFTLASTILRTSSRGTVRLASADPDEMPLIDPATYTAPGDMQSMVAGIRALREIASTPALAEWGAAEALPGRDIDGDAELEHYVRGATFTASHPVGACRMGVDADAVVDPMLRCYGIDGLRIADSSIMPAITSGNTHVPTLVIGERAADLLGATPAGAAPPGATQSEGSLACS